MRLTFRAPFDTDRFAQVKATPGHTLGQYFAEHAEHITGAMANQDFLEEWRTYEPSDDDHLTVFVETGVIVSTLVTLIIVAVASIALQFAIQAIIRAVTPTPSQKDGKTEQIYGIAGLTNTTSQGTPKLMCYGTRRVYGHILTTRASINDDGSQMSFAILYFMGEGEIEDITEPQINDIAADQFSGIEVYTRLGGSDNATLIHDDFSTLSQVWSDGRQLPLGIPIVYQTRSADTSRITLFISAPFLHKDDPNKESTQHFLVEKTTVLANRHYRV